MKFSPILAFAIFFVLTGCDSEGVTRPSPTEVYWFNAAANLEVIAFLREEIPVRDQSFSYDEGARVRHDSGQFDFHLETSPLGATARVRAFSSSQDLAPDRKYIFVVTAPGGQPEFYAASIDAEPQDPTSTRLTLAHGFQGLGALDVYVEPPGTLLDIGLRRGTISFGPDVLSVEVAPATYQIFLTTPDDPADIVFEAAAQPLPTGGDFVLVVSDPGTQGSLDINVSQVSEDSGRIGQVGQQAELRVIQAIDDRIGRDIYLDDTTMPPLFPAQPFGEISAYVPVDVGGHTVITTPIGAPGTEESSQNYISTAVKTNAALIAGDTTDGVTTVLILEDKRSISGQATLRIYNGAGQFVLASFYIEEPGTDITTVDPLFSLGVPGASPRIPILPGDYEVTIEDALTATTIAGPQLVTLDDGGVYGFLLINGPDTSTVDIELFDDFVP
jgi:hypothetical protein